MIQNSIHIIFFSSCIVSCFVVNDFFSVSRIHGGLLMTEPFFSSFATPFYRFISLSLATSNKYLIFSLNHCYVTTLRHCIQFIRTVLRTNPHTHTHKALCCCCCCRAHHKFEYVGLNISKPCRL